MIHIDPRLVSHETLPLPSNWEPMDASLSPIGVNSTRSATPLLPYAPLVDHADEQSPVGPIYPENECYYVVDQDYQVSSSH